MTFKPGDILIKTKNSTENYCCPVNHHYTFIKYNINAVEGCNITVRDGDNDQWVDIGSRYTLVSDCKYIVKSSSVDSMFVTYEAAEKEAKSRGCSSDIYKKITSYRKERL